MKKIILGLLLGASFIACEMIRLSRGCFGRSICYASIINKKSGFEKVGYIHLYLMMFASESKLFLEVLLMVPFC
jgi:hypothetical protein